MKSEGAEVACVSPPCMGCGGEHFSIVVREVSDWVWHKPGAFTLAECEACALVMTRPRPADIGPYYEGAYAGDTPAGKFKRETEAWEGGWINTRRMAVLRDHVPLDGSSHVLDVGCSHGGYLKQIRARFGSKTTGIDFDEASIAEAFEPEHCTYLAGTLLDAGLPGDSFDAVTFIECLEHDPDPLGSLREASRVVRPGGMVLVEVPNFDGFWRGVFGRFWLPLLTPQHMVHFTMPTLTALMQKADLEIVHQQCMNFPLEGVASLWLVWCAKTGAPPAGAPIRPRVVFDLFVVVWLVALYFLVEVPSQWWLARRGRSGHMTVVGRRPL